MAPPRPPTCEIRRIRLINFHNFVDEVIDLRQGGHLFLLGDNGCGKTTVLDAVHYVLTAGRRLEFNAAARVAGGRREGRREQGIVMRYNVDTGAMNPGGGIAYAALEIAGRQGKPTTLAVGLSTRAMDEAVRRWGIIRECPLEEVPLLIEELDGRRRPAAAEELRQRMGSGFYSQIGAYQKEVGERFFGGPELYEETSRLLGMGKAYREIVASAGDYHELFRRLLPEPDREIFQRIVETLTSLDRSQAELLGLQQRLEWLRGLQQLVAEVARHRLEQLRYDWLSAQLRRESCAQQIAQLAHGRQSVVTSLDEVRQQLAASRLDQQRLEALLADLQQRDGSGLVRQEQEMAAQVARLDEQVGSREAAARQAEREHQERTRLRDQQRKELCAEARRCHQALSRMAPALPFSTGDLAEQLVDALRAEAPEQSLANLHQPHLRREADAAATQTAVAHVQHEREVAALKQQVADLDQRIKALRDQAEAQPRQPDFALALQALREAMITATPLYAGLEWQPGLSRAARAAVEEAIGEDVLATLLVPTDQHAAARQTLFARVAAIRLAHPNSADIALPEWMRQAFEIAKCDPRALTCLAAEMVAGHGPAVDTWMAHQVLRFRAHERRLTEQPARLIGSESRRLACEQEIRALQGQLKPLATAQREADRQMRAAADLRQQIEALRHLLTDELPALEQVAHQVRSAGLAVDRAATDHASLAQRLTEQRAEHDHHRQRLVTVRARIAQEGLDKLDRQVAELQRKLEREREHDRNRQREAGRLQGELEACEQQGEGLAAEQARLTASQADSAARLQQAEPEIGDVAYYVLKTWKGAQFKTVEAVDAARQAAQKAESERQGSLSVSIRHPLYGTQYGLVYEAGANDLRDRRACPIVELRQAEERTVAEQQELINEKTNELFRTVVMDELMRYFKEHVSRLDTMLKRIDQKLGERQFGNQRYRLQLREIDACRRLVAMVREFNYFDPRTSDDLRHFFEDHRDEIKHTEVGEIPHLLDYRNWYHYDLAVCTVNDEGVVMDQRTKSLGSGGEQAVPNYLLILTIADFHYTGNGLRLPVLLFDEAFYGIDSGRRDQLLGFASDLGLQLLVASPDQDGVKQEIPFSTTLLIVKDEQYHVHLYPYYWENPEARPQGELLVEYQPTRTPIAFQDEVRP